MGQCKCVKHEKHKYREHLIPVDRGAWRQHGKEKKLRRIFEDTHSESDIVLRTHVSRKERELSFSNSKVNLIQRSIELTEDSKLENGVLEGIGKKV